MKEININNFDEKLYYEKLDNGLEVFVVPLKNTKTYYVNLAVKFGGANRIFKLNGKEYIVPTGIAHFLEHKLFDRKDNPFDFYMKSGTDVNASTNNDSTSYYIYGNSNFDDNLRYFLNWVTNFSITKEQVEKERGIILEESSMYKDIPNSVLYETLSSNLFVNHPYKDKAIGTDSDINSITKEQLELCYRTFYRPDNMYLVAAGDINQDNFIKIVKEELKDYKRSNDVVEVLKIDEPNEVKKEYEEIQMPVEVNKLAIGYKMNRSLFKDINIDRYTLDYYMQMILNMAFGSSSIFVEQMYLKNIVQSVTYELVDIEDYYTFNFYVSTDKTKEFLEELNKYIKDLELDIDTFNRIIKLWVASEVRMIDQAVSAAKNIIYDIIDYGDFKNNKIKDIRNLDYNILLEVYKKMDFSNKCIVNLISNKEKTVA
jgi:predicted Zn-dependent peptidase